MFRLSKLANKLLPSLRFQKYSRYFTFSTDRFLGQRDQQNQELRRILNIDAKLAQHSVHPLSIPQSLSLLSEINLTKSSVDLNSASMLSLMLDLSLSSLDWENEQDIAKLVVQMHNLKINSPQVWESVKNAVLVKIQDDLLLLQLLKILVKNGQIKFEVNELEHKQKQELKIQHQHFKTVLKIKQMKLENTFEVIHCRLWIASFVEGFESEIDRLKQKYLEILEAPQFQEKLLEISKEQIPLQIMALNKKHKLKLSKEISTKILILIESLCKRDANCEIENQQFLNLMGSQIKECKEAMDSLSFILTARSYCDYSLSEKDVHSLLEMSNYFEDRKQLQNVLLYEANRVNNYILEKLAEIELTRQSELAEIDANQTHINERVDFDQLRTKAVSRSKKEIYNFLNKIDWGLWRILNIRLLRKEVKSQSVGLRMFLSGIRKLIEDPRVSHFLTIDDYEEILDQMTQLPQQEVNSNDLHFVFRKLHNLKALYTI